MADKQTENKTNEIKMMEKWKKQRKREQEGMIHAKNAPSNFPFQWIKKHEKIKILILFSFILLH